MSRQDKGGAGMILNRGPPSGFETSNEISNSGGTDMYIEHPYFYEGKYYANIIVVIFLLRSGVILRLRGKKASA